VIGERSEGPILRRRDGHRLDRRTAHRWVRSIGKQAGLGIVHPHMLRAAFIMAALDAGVPLRDVQIAARQADPRTTTIYDRRRENFDRHARLCRGGLRGRGVRQPAQRVSHLAGVLGHSGGWHDITISRVYMYSSQRPSDDVLVELGRLTWTAICLEDVTEPICWKLDPSSTREDKRPVGARLDAALVALKKLRSSDQQTRAIEWIMEAKAALEARHAIFHGIPGTFVPLGEGFQAGNQDQVLAHVSRRDDRGQTNTPITVEGLLDVRVRLEKARDGWEVVAFSPKE
jgi:hypothetical protein